ncbi:MAG: VOC family protein [Sandaracinus sp.]|jgi:catechol 2,3-dioxygenase-like lactoylglutathione lyase family enzyme|nr:VOC family protein [Sandaracinus sp.]MCB9620703.1 VOC family protein [Sandaracinus sp.]MCB9630735.1 VOC family protein [Sandaracinus sp.]
MKVRKIHHVAYRCNDAKETVEWYGKHLKMDFVLAIAEDQVPSTKEPDPYMHVFLDAGNGNVLAFFELPTRPAMGKDPNTPEWVQHIAFEVADRETLLAFRASLEAEGIEVLGVTDHSLFHSIYFFDPNGHRIELACPDPEEEAKLRRLDQVKWEMLEEWSRTKKAPRHAAWMHEKQFSE